MSPHRNQLLALILLGLWFGMLVLGGPDSKVDPALLAMIHAHALVPAARVITRLGNWPILVPLTFAATLILAWRVSRRSAFVFAMMIVTGRALVEFEKAMVGRQRPPPVGRLDLVTSLSYPSAHAAYSMMTWLGFALLAAPARHRSAAVAAAVALALVVGLTRLVLAVHWPSDVIGGWAFGAGWALLFARLAVPGEGTAPAPRH